MADDKKKSAMSMFGGGDDAPADDDKPEAGSDPFDQACDEILVAIKAGDKAGFCDALKAAIDIHTSAGSDADEEPEPPEAA